MGFQWAEVYATLVFKMNEWGALYFRGSESQVSTPRIGINTIYVGEKVILYIVIYMSCGNTLLAY